MPGGVQRYSFPRSDLKVTLDGIPLHRDIDRTIRELRALRKDLATALDVAKSSAERGDDVVVCPIIELPADAER